MPSKGNRFLEVKLMWGQMALDAKVFSEVDTLTVGNKKSASFRFDLDSFPGDVFTLLSPDGSKGHIVHLASGMRLDVRRKGQDMDVDGLASHSAVRTYRLGTDDRVRVSMGQLAFLIQYTPAALGVQSKAIHSRDYQMGKWWWTFFVVFIGLWFLMEVTPELKKDGLYYLKNPARFARLIASTKQAIKKTVKKTSLGQALRSLNKRKVNDKGGFGWVGIIGGGGRLTFIARGSYGKIEPFIISRAYKPNKKIRIRKGKARIIGTLSKKVIGKNIKRYWAQFKFCYERELSNKPKLRGKITSTFTVSENGRVTEAHLTRSTMHNKIVEQCILRVIRRIRFPHPKGGGEVKVTYPFMFTKTG